MESLVGSCRPAAATPGGDGAGDVEDVGGGTRLLVGTILAGSALLPAVFCLRVELGPGGERLSDVAEEERPERVLAAEGAWISLGTDGERFSGMGRDEDGERRELDVVAVGGTGW